MNEKKDEDSKEKSRGKSIPKFKEAKHATKSVEPSGRKSTAHSGIYFPVRVKKPTDFAAESRHEQVDTCSILTKKNEPRISKKEEETLLTSIENLKIPMEPAVDLCETKTHIDERVASKFTIPHQCQGTCKCPNSIKLLHYVCSPQKAEIHGVGKDANESHNIPLSKSVKTRHTANDTGKKEKTGNSTMHPVCSELKPQKRRSSNLRPPSDYKCKPASAFSETKIRNFIPTSASTPRPTSVPATQPEFVSNTGPSSEPTMVSVSLRSSFEGSDADKLVSPPESYMPSSETASDLTNMVELQSSSRPAFWPPSALDYKIIHAFEPSTVPVSNPLSPIKFKTLSEQKSEPSRVTKTVPSSLSTKITKGTQKCASSSRTSRIPKIHPNPATDTKKQTKSTVKKVEVSQKKSCK